MRWYWWSDIESEQLFCYVFTMENIELGNSHELLEDKVAQSRIPCVDKHQKDDVLHASDQTPKLLEDSS